MNIIFDEERLKTLSDSVKSTLKIDSNEVLSFNELSDAVKSTTATHKIDLSGLATEEGIENFDVEDLKVIPKYSLAQLNAKKVTGAEVTDVNENAFRESKIVEFDFPKLERIYSYAFYNCTSLVTALLSDSVRNLDPYAFYNCSKLSNLTLSNKLYYVGKGSFSNCASLESVIIPSDVCYIDQVAFSYCKALKTVNIKSTSITISKDAFSNCTNLTDIYVPWESGKVSNAPWGASKATIHYETVHPGVGIAFRYDKEDALVSDNAVTPTLVGVDEDGDRTSLPTDANITWSIDNTDKASIDSSTGTITFTGIDSNDIFHVTASSETYGTKTEVLKVFKPQGIIETDNYKIDTHDGCWIGTGETRNGNKIYRCTYAFLGKSPEQYNQFVCRITSKNYSKLVVYLKNTSYYNSFQFSKSINQYVSNWTTYMNKSDWYKFEFDTRSGYFWEFRFYASTLYDNHDADAYFYVAEDECELLS